MMPSLITRPAGRPDLHACLAAQGRLMGFSPDVEIALWYLLGPSMHMLYASLPPCLRPRSSAHRNLWKWYPSRFPPLHPNKGKNFLSARARHLAGKSRGRTLCCSGKPTQMLILPCNAKKPISPPPPPCENGLSNHRRSLLKPPGPVCSTAETRLLNRRGPFTKPPGPVY